MRLAPKKQALFFFRHFNTHNNGPENGTTTGGHIMFELYIAMTAATITGGIIMAVIGFCAFTNKKFVKWYTKKIASMTEVILDESLKATTENKTDD